MSLQQYFHAYKYFRRKWEARPAFLIAVGANLRELQLLADSYVEMEKPLIRHYEIFYATILGIEYLWF